MNILFITFGEIGLWDGGCRSYAIIRALSDVGCRIDLIASHSNLPEHNNIRNLIPEGRASVRKHRLRIEVLKAIGRKSYDAVHAVDEAALFVAQAVWFRKSHLIYDAGRCFSGPFANPPSRLATFFPSYFQRLEQKIIKRALVVLVPCETLFRDLKEVDPGAPVSLLEDIPLHALCSGEKIGKEALISQFERPQSSVVVCSVLGGGYQAVRDLLKAIRKVLDAYSNVFFFIKGARISDAEELVANLEIREHCSFLKPDETGVFLAALELADVALLMSDSNQRYVAAETYTLLQAPAPLLAVHATEWGSVLNEQNSIQVLPDSSSIAEGIIRILREPLFSLGIADEGQRLIADRYSHSSFKHKVRMIYRDILSEK